MLQNVKKALANSEPSTHGTYAKCHDVRCTSAIGGTAENGHRQTDAIDCQISSAALDDLAGQRSKPPQVLNRDAQFLEFRDQIEKLASDQFDRDIESKPKLVRIFAKHIPKAGPGT
jgi:hypothetical protein